jgi:hypothetical protein
LGINPLSHIWFTIIFSQSTGFLSILLLMSFIVQKNFHLDILVQLVSFCLCCLNLWCNICKKYHCQDQNQGAFPLCFLVRVL